MAPSITFFPSTNTSGSDRLVATRSPPSTFVLGNNLSRRLYLRLVDVNSGFVPAFDRAPPRRSRSGKKQILSRACSGLHPVPPFWTRKEQPCQLHIFARRGYDHTSAHAIARLLRNFVDALRFMIPNASTQQSRNLPNHPPRLTISTIDVRSSYIWAPHLPRNLSHSAIRANYATRSGKGL
jgi:hypothetical protein